MATVTPTLSPQIAPTFSWDVNRIIPLDYQLPARIWETVSPELIRDCRILLGRDVYSEGDAQFLYDYLFARAADFSPALLAYLPQWLRDEQTHYQAMRRMYHCLSGEDFAAMDAHFQKRCPQVAPIAPVLTDEFTLLATLVFDEAGSMFSYRRDWQEFYRPFGPVFSRVAQHLVQDEGRHFHVFLTILATHYGDRLSELPHCLDQILALEQTLGRYTQLFLLDHAQEMHRFPHHFSTTVRQWILAQLQLAPPPSPAQIRSLSAPIRPRTLPV